MYDFETIDEAWLRGKPGEKWRHAAPRLAAWVADMDFRPAPVITDHLRSIIDCGDLGYPDRIRTGRSRAVDAFVDQMAVKYNWSIEAHHVREWNDVVQSLQAFLHVICAPGDRVVVHTPAYPPFFDSISQAKCELLAVPARIDGDIVDFDHAALERQLSLTPARVLLLCNPQNPTGHVFTREELGNLVDIATRHNLIIISDEIHADIVFDGHRHIPVATIPGAASRTITLNSASKSFNIAGLHYSVSHCGDATIETRLSALPTHIFGGEANIMGAEAAWAAWTMGGEWFDACRRHLQLMRDRTLELCASLIPTVKVNRPDATYLAWLDFRGTPIAEHPHRFIRAAGVELSNGILFGPGGEGHVRLNFATSTEILSRLIRAVASAVDDRV